MKRIHVHIFLLVLGISSNAAFGMNEQNITDIYHPRNEFEQLIINHHGTQRLTQENTTDIEVVIHDIEVIGEDISRISDDAKELYEDQTIKLEQIEFDQDLLDQNQEIIDSQVLRLTEKNSKRKAEIQKFKKDVMYLTFDNEMITSRVKKLEKKRKTVPSQETTNKLRDLVNKKHKKDDQN